MLHETASASSVPSPRPDHHVHFYEDDLSLFPLVGQFIGDGLASGQPIIVIATPEHTAAFIRDLTPRGVDVEAALAAGRLLLMDADATLSQFMIDGMPDEGRFAATVGALVERQLRDRNGASIRAYGEMVNLLWERGQRGAAIRLEEHWHRLAGQHPFTLLCAYAMGPFFNVSEPGPSLDDVCRTHSYITPTSAVADATRGGRKRVARTLLEHRARALETEVEHRRQFEAALRSVLAERESVDTKLREAEQQLRDFVENAVDGMHWIGPDGTILWANAAELKLLGYPRDEYIGHHIREFHAEAPVIDDILARLARNEALHDYAARLRCKDGSIRDVVIDSSVYWRNGEFVHTRCITRDVTEQKRVAEQRRRVVQQLAVEHAVTKLLADGQTLGEVAPALLQAISEFGDWQVAALWMADKPEERLHCVEFWHAQGVDVAEFETATRSCSFARGVGLPGRVWSLGRPCWVDDFVTDTTLPRAPIADRAGLHGASGFAVRANGRIVGVLEFLGRCARQPEPDLLTFLETVGTQIGHFIERREIEEIRERLSAIVDSSDDAIVGKTLSGVITSWNRGAENIFGYTAMEAVGRHISLIIPADLLPEEETVLERIRRGEKIDHFETERQAKDGRRLNISLTVSPIRNTDGRIIGASKVARDITVQKMDARALAESERRLREADRRKDEFLALLAHELRNPLAPIRTGLELIRLSGDQPETIRRVRSMMERQVGHMVRLIDDLLDVSRITSGKIVLQRVPTPIAEIVRGAIDAQRAAIASAGLELTVELPEEPCVVDADPTRLVQVLSNIIHNAWKFTPAPGQIRVSVEAADGALVIAIADTGIGIPHDMRQRVFDLFTQCEQPAGRQHDGLGIGLALARRLVEMHNGRIDVFSDGPGLGSRFVIRLPTAQSVAITPGQSQERARRISSRVLIVDDHEDAANTMAMLVEALGGTARTAHDARSGLNAMAEFQPDVVILDIGMPGMDGYEACRLIRLKPSNRHILVIAMTGWGHTEHKQRAIEMGFDAHLTKPVDPAALEELLAASQAGACSSTMSPLED